MKFLFVANKENTGKSFPKAVAPQQERLGLLLGQQMNIQAGRFCQYK